MCLWRAVMSMLKTLAALFFKANVEVGKRGESENLNCKFKKDKFSNKDFLFESIYPHVHPHLFILHCTQLNYMVIKMHCFFLFFFLSMEDKIRVFVITSPEQSCG